MNSPIRAPNACGVVRVRMPDGFCPPFQCQSGIIAKSTMHQAKAMPTQTFSDLCAGFHQMPWRGFEPGMRVSVHRSTSGQRGSSGRLVISHIPQPV